MTETAEPTAHPTAPAAPAAAPPGLATQVYQVLIRATPEQVWAAITTPEFTTRYFHGARVETSGRTGEPLRYFGPDGATWGDETIIEADPPRRLVVPWRSLYSDTAGAEPASRITWQITDRDGGVCLLTVTHDRLDESPITATSVAGIGWLTVLHGMKTLLETGEPLFAPTA